MNRLVAAISAVAVLAAGCSGSSGAGNDIVVLAPSSMVDLLSEGKIGFVRLTPADPSGVSFSFAGSNALVSQLRDGAHADVLITASRSTMERAITEGSVASQPTVIARNRLVLAVAAGNPGGISSLEDLGDPSKVIGLCAPQVPCGELSSEALDTLGVAASADTLEPNVRALANKIKLGEVDAGLVYRTDAKALGLSTITAPNLYQFSTEYLVAAIGAAPGQTIGLFIDMLSGPGSIRERMIEMGFEDP